MSQISVYVDTSEVLSEVSDKDLIDELKDRKLDGSVEQIEFGHRKDELIRAIAHRDWPEVEYLMRTYFLREELRFVPVRAPALRVAA